MNKLIADLRMLSPLNFVIVVATPLGGIALSSVFFFG